MAVLDIDYEGRQFLLDIEDLDTDQMRTIERFGIPNLKALEERFQEGDLDALTAYYWLCLVQNGEPGARIERVRFKPLKFLVALAMAAKKIADAAEADAESGKE